MEKGRKVCNELKAIRKKIAEANDIEYTPNECTHKGECAGTCPACEAEVKYLEKQLSMRQLIGKAAVVAGLSLSVASCVGGIGSPTKGDVARVDSDTVEALAGDVEALAGDVACPVDSATIDSADSLVNTEAETDR